MFNTTSWELCLPYLAVTVTFIIGVIVIRKEISAAKGVEKIIGFGPMFLAIPMVVFGTNHLVFSESVVPGVPSWIPWHLFWVLSVGFCLIAGGLSLVLRRYATLAAALFGVMLLSFELLIHIPRILQAPSDRFAWAVALRDLAFAAGAISFAASNALTQRKRLAGYVIAISRFSLGVAAVFFGVEHFLHPEFKPGVPLKQLTPAWIPARVPLGYLTGAILLIAGLALIFNKRAKTAATGMGPTLFLLVLVVYLPIVIAQPSAIGSGLNYLVDTLLFSGSALCFAGSQHWKHIGEDS